MQDKFALVIAGASGAGKSSVAQRLSEIDTTYSFSRSATTRPKRADGREDEYYYFTTEEFSALINEGRLVEYTDYGKNCYGTLYSELQRIHSLGKNPLLILDLNGVISFRRAKLDYPVYAVYVYEELEEVEKRLRKRDIGTVPLDAAYADFHRRIEQNRKDYLSMPELCKYFDLIVRNDDLDRCIGEILDFLKRLRSAPTVQPKKAELASLLAKNAEAYSPKN